MFSLFNQCANIVSSFIAIFQLIVWAISSIDDVAGLLSSALRSIIALMDIFPSTVASALMGVCGGLFVLRIFGRS